jgi:hypothetical protein
VPHICSSMGKVPNIGGKLITHILRLNRAVWTWVSLDCIKWLCLRLGYPIPSINSWYKKNDISHPWIKYRSIFTWERPSNDINWCRAW